VSDNTVIRQIIAGKLKAKRTEMKVSLRMVESITGVNNAIISMMENNRYNFDSYSKLEKLCKYYGLDMNTLHEVEQ
jgi:transcriptional regulator with XRE-family HTH domain